MRTALGKRPIRNKTAAIYIGYIDKPEWRKFADSVCNPLHLVKRDLITAAVVQPGGAG